MFPVQHIILVSCIAAAASGQTPPGISPATNRSFSVQYNGLSNFTEGELLTTPVVAHAPSVGTYEYLSGTYTIVMMDPDGVYQGANTTVLHWLRTNNTISSASSPGTGIYPLGNSTMQDASDLAPYYPPSPPFEVPAHAHHYTLLLFEQADEKDVVITEQLNQSLTYRVGFNLSDFVDNSGIGPLVAAKYFTLINTTSTANTSSGASGARLTASVTPLFTSAASPVNVLRPGHYVGIGVLSFLWRACLG